MIVGSVLLQDEYNNSSSGDVYINMDSTNVNYGQRLQLVAEDVSSSFKVYMWSNSFTNGYFFNLAAGSVLLLDEANSSSDVAINMDAVDRERYTTQMQLIEQDVSGNS